MAKKIMIGLEPVGTIDGNQTRRRILQKAKAFCRKNKGFSVIFDDENKIFVSDHRKKIPVWVYDDTQEATLKNSGFVVSWDEFTNGGHGPGNFDNRGGYRIISAHKGFDGDEKDVKRDFFPSTSSSHSKWARDYQTEFPSDEENDLIVSEIENDPRYYQAMMQGYVL